MRWQRSAHRLTEERETTPSAEARALKPTVVFQASTVTVKTIIEIFELCEAYPGLPPDLRKLTHLVVSLRLEEGLPSSTR